VGSEIPSPGEGMDIGAQGRMATRRGMYHNPRRFGLAIHNGDVRRCGPLP